MAENTKIRTVQCKQCGTVQTIELPIKDKKCVFCGWKELVVK